MEKEKPNKLSESSEDLPDDEDLGATVIVQKSEPFLRHGTFSLILKMLRNVRRMFVVWRARTQRMKTFGYAWICDWQIGQFSERTTPYPFLNPS